MTRRPPIAVIDYPEARRVALHLEQVRGVQPLQPWPAFGYRPETMRARTRELPERPFVVLNGSGNYHHETYAIVQSLCRRGDCAYVHIDAHPDKDTFFRWKLDCASFVGGLIEHPRVDEGVLLGINPLPELVDLPGIIFGNELSYYRCSYFERLRCYTARPSDIDEAHLRYTRADGVSARRNASVLKASAAPLRANPKRHKRGLLVRWRDLTAFDPSSIRCDRIYLSVDLDVLRDAVVTDWRRKSADAVTPRRGLSLSDVLGVPIPGREVEAAAVVDPVFADNQGELTLAELLALIARIGAARTVIGADICGLTEHFADLPPQRLSSSLDAIVAVYDAIAATL